MNTLEKNASMNVRKKEGLPPISVDNIADNIAKLGAKMLGKLNDVSLETQQGPTVSKRKTQVRLR